MSGLVDAPCSHGLWQFSCVLAVSRILTVLIHRPGHLLVLSFWWNFHLHRVPELCLERFCPCCSHNTAEKYGQHFDYHDVSRLWTDILLTTRHFTQTGSLGGLVGIHHIVGECRALENGAQTTTHPSRAPTRPRYILQPQRGEASTERQEIRFDLQAIADCLQKGDKRVEFLQAVDSSFEKAKSKCEALREDPTPDTHWALWVDCMKETAQKFFSLHRTSK